MGLVIHLQPPLTVLKHAKATKMLASVYNILPRCELGSIASPKRKEGIPASRKDE